MRIKQLILQTAALNQTAEFYGRTLGLPVSTTGLREITVTVGSTELIFTLAKNGNPFYHLAFNIPCNQIAEATAWCKLRNLTLLPFENNTLIDFPNWNAQSIYFTDNNGSILEFIARHDLKNSADGAFTSSCMLNVSEIGLVTDSVPKLCNYIKENTGVNYYDKQPPADTFSVMGSASGLFIVVPAGRNWFPTQIQAAAYPTQATINYAGNKFTVVV
ncbi:MAG: hypothetical protein RLZZ367_1087 [Bacteroidota bacterium]|jgi:hypothetical protein